MLTPLQLQEFKEKGYFRLPAAIPQEQTAEMEKSIWKCLQEQKGIKQHAPETWISGQNVGLSHLRKESPFQFYENLATTNAINDILGENTWKKPFNWGQLLVSFPEPEMEWTVPYDIWHTDFDFLTPPDEVHGALLFCFVTKVEPQSGGTGVISGSHRLVQRFVERQLPENLVKMKKVRKALCESEAWLEKLCTKNNNINRIAYFMESTHEVAGIPLRVEELTGEAGDVIIGHPWLLHATTSNCGQQARMMCVHRIHIKDSG